MRKCPACGYLLLGAALPPATMTPPVWRPAPTAVVVRPPTVVRPTCGRGHRGARDVHGGKARLRRRRVAQTRGTAATLETRFKFTDGYDAHILVMITGSHLYVLYVHAKEGTDRLYSALDKSFEVRAS